MNNLLRHIQSPKDLRKLQQSQLPQLAQEIRDFILDVVSVKPGHLGASLGVVELTIALHYHYETPEDLIVWDVGHQSYPHKLLTGRQGVFDSLRQLGGISGFPVRTESEYDAFGTGHSSTSISAITGMALANQLQHKTNQHIAVIGDASIVSGMAFEGLNHLGDTGLNVLIVLNDNNIGIDPSVGALQNFLNQNDQRPNSFFESLGFYYQGIINGHHIAEVLAAFKELDQYHGPKVLHVRTKKGKGYAEAEKDQILWHAPGTFDKITGKISNTKSSLDYATTVGNFLNDILTIHPNTAVITPAMPTGSGLVKLMQNFPERVWDVGIAEQHAVTLGAGLATQKIKPFVVIYSTFLQRAYDQVIHDVALQNLPVVFMVDRAGITGSDGATHHGYYDIAMLNMIPNLTVAAAANAQELKELMDLAIDAETPWAIRYPKGLVNPNFRFKGQTAVGKAKEILKGNKIAILSTGHIAENIDKAMDGLNVSWYHFPFVKPLDKNCLRKVFEEHDVILTFEAGVIQGGFGSSVLMFANEIGFQGKIKLFGYPDAFIEHGSVEELTALYQLDSQSIYKEICSHL